MYSIAVLTDDTPQKKRVETLLKKNLNFDVQLYKSAGDILPPISAGRVAGIVILTKHFCKEHIHLLHSLSSKLNNSPLVLSSTFISQELRVQYIRNQNKSSLILDMRHELPHLNFMLEKAIASGGLPNRAYCRYNVTNNGFISDLASGKVHRIQVLDLSYGGARIKLPRGVNITSPLVSLDIEGMRDKSYNVIGKVAWVAKNGQLGIQFERHFALQEVA